MNRVLPVARVFYPAVRTAEKSFAFYDLSDCLDNFEAPAYADECHFLNAATPAVAAAVCDVIAPAVVKVGKLPME